MNGPKIWTFDVETSLLRAVLFQIHNNYMPPKNVTHDFFVMTWAGKFLHEDYIWSDSMFHYKKHYKEDSENDYYVMLTLRDFLDEADIVVGHNSKKFDVPKVLGRMLALGIDPPSPFKQMDTCAIAKRKFGFTSNSLDFIAGQVLGIGEKEDNGGIQRWKDCLEGKPQAWKDMLLYNEQDTLLTEELFIALAPHAGQKPNYGLYAEGDVPRCTSPACGSTNVIRKGWDYSGVSTFRRFKCNDCGNPMRNRLRESPKKNLLVSIA